MSFHIDDDKLLKIYKTICTNIESLQNIKLNTLPVYHDRYIETKINTSNYKVYTHFYGLNGPKNGVE